MIKIVVPVSGGKDSQSALKLALAIYSNNEVRGLFCDTQFEHPLTYQHVDKLRTLYGPIQIDTITGGSVLEKCVKHGRFPGGGARHCTDELKIRISKKYYKALAESQGQGFEVWYGMRSGESDERSKRYDGKMPEELYAPHEVMPSKYPKYLAKLGVMFRLIVLHWSELQILDFLNGEENPLYRAGFSRVGCFPCLAAGDKYKEKAYAFDDFGRMQKERVKEVSIMIDKSMWSSKGGKKRNAVCSFCSE